MKLRMHTLLVLMKKDCKMMFSNKNVIIMILLPLAFCVIYQYLFAEMMAQEGGEIGFVITLCSIVNVCAIALNGLAMMVAEEKEKNTLRVLMLSDVSAVEYILSKLLVMLFASEVVGVLMYFITGCPVEGLLAYVIVTTLTALSLLLFGAVIGLLSKDQMSTGTISAPLMLLFMMPPVFGQASELFRKIAVMVPTNAMFEMVNQLSVGQSVWTSAYLQDYFMLAAWIIIGILVFYLVYKKRMRDN